MFLFPSWKLINQIINHSFCFDKFQFWTLHIKHEECKSLLSTSCFCQMQPSWITTCCSGLPDLLQPLLAKTSILLRLFFYWKCKKIHFETDQRISQQVLFFLRASVFPAKTAHGNSTQSGFTVPLCVYWKKRFTKDFRHQINRFLLNSTPAIRLALNAFMFPSKSNV